MPIPARDWDARTYDRVSDPHQEWAGQMLARLPLHGDETVLDAGCGSGRVTRRLLERLPHGHIYGVDASPAMLAVAREQLAEYGDRVALVEADLTTVRLPEPLDAIFSSATFHWIPNHVALFTNLAALLKPGGTLVAQCGGEGNIAALRRFAAAALSREPFAPYSSRVQDAWTFAGPEETAERLRGAGFTAVETWLAPEPAAFAGAAAFATFIKTVVLGPYLAALPEPLHDGFVRVVVEEDERGGGARTVDYMRLNMNARRAGA